MNKQDLQFLLAFASKKGMMHLSFEEVLAAAGNYLCNCAEAEVSIEEAMASILSK